MALVEGFIIYTKSGNTEKEVQNKGKYLAHR